MKAAKGITILIIAISISACASSRDLYLTQTGFYGIKKGATKEDFAKWWIEPNKRYRGAKPVWQTILNEGGDTWEILVFDVYDAPSVLHGNPEINHQEYVAFRNGVLEKWGTGTQPDVFSAEHERSKEVISPEEMEKALGTAWPTEYGYIVTCRHVIDRRKNIQLIRTDGVKIAARVYLSDMDNDIALLLPESFESIPAPFAISDAEPRMGADVFTIGFPLPHITGFSPKLFPGSINSTKGLKNDPNTMQMSAPVQQGNSGGPLFNSKGEVIGITSVKLKAIRHFNWYGDIPQNINYATKSAKLMELLKRAPAPSDAGTLKPVQTDGLSLEDMVEKMKDSVLLVTGE